MNTVKLSQIEASLKAMDDTRRWETYIGWLRGFEPFIDKAILEMAAHAGSSSPKIATHRETMAACFTLLDDWYHGRKPPVKARRKEIDSAISFLRNTALQAGVRTMPGAACVRNLAGVLRSAVYLSIHDYQQKDYPSVMTNSFFNMAATRSAFPADTSDFVQFLRPDENIVAVMLNGRPIKANIDNLQVMAKRGCERLGIPEVYERLQAEIQHMQANLSTPTPWQPPDNLWRIKESSILSDIHYKALHDFLRRS